MGAKLASGGGKKRGRYSANPDPNVIPFIDVMLVLLIIFMVTSPPPTTEVRVQLPPPNALQQVTENKPTFVYLQKTGDGGLAAYVDEKEVAFEDLGAAVLERVPFNNPNPKDGNIFKAKIFVRADQGLQYRYVMEGFDKIQLAGFTDVGLVAEDAQVK